MSGDYWPFLADGICADESESSSHVILTSLSRAAHARLNALYMCNKVGGEGGAPEGGLATLPTTSTGLDGGIGC